MKTPFTRLFTGVVLLLLFLVSSVSAQNTSNSGTNFWIGYTGHIDGTKSQMSLYLTSSVNTTAIVSIPQLGISDTYAVSANNVTVVPISSLAYVGTSEVIENKGIQVVSEHPIVVYSHIYSQNRSGATLVLPTNTLGREYFAASYQPDFNGQYAEFMVIATEDNTLVEITPKAATRSGKAANVPFQINLNKGQVYQVQSTADLTGSKIVSVSNGTNSCKKIAVFSGNTFVGIGCSNIGSRDNLYQQLYPLSTWGSNFVTAPLKTRTGGDVFRVLAAFQNTTVTVNGSSQTLNAGEFWEFTSATANFITSSNPVTLLQYARTQGCDNVTGDPEMIILNPVEQTLEDITLYSSPYYMITGHYINVVMRTEYTQNFRLDGAPVSFTPVAANPEYAYAQVTVGAGNHRLTSKGGFNAMAYGFGNVESYGYSAGANIKNLNQNITFNAQSYCFGETVSFTGFASYTPQSWLWEFGDGSTSVEQNPTYTYKAPGTYTVKLTTIKNNGNDCDSKDETTAELIVYPNPVADFTFALDCLNEAILFKDASTVAGTNSQVVEWLWDFGDGNTSAEQNPRHSYSSPKVYTVKLTTKTNAGCTNEVTKQVEMLPKPVLNFEAPAVCNGAISNFTDKSFSVVPVTGWSWDFGDGSPVATNQHPQHLYATAGTYDVTLTLTFAPGCQTSLTKKVIVYPKPQVAMELPDVCISDEAHFVNKSTIVEGTLTYLWEFGDGSTSTEVNPKHRYTAEKEYTVRLTATSDKGCSETIETSYVVSGANPKADFTASEFCQRQGVQFTDGSTVPFGKIVRWEWDFGDGTTSSEQNPNHVYAKADKYKVTLTAYSGIICQATITKEIIVNPSPVASFVTSNVCQGEPVRFKNSSSVQGGAITSYRWDFGDGKSSILPDPEHYYTEPGTYPVTLYVTTDKGCMESDFKLVTVYPVPQAAFSPVVGCVTDEVLFRDESTIAGGLIASWFWNFGDGTTSIEQHPKHRFANAATYNVQLEVTTTSGCKSVIIKPVLIKALPTANAGPDQIPVCGATSTMLAASNPAPGTGLWTILNGAGGQFSDPANPATTFTGRVGENYKLRWTVSNSPCATASDEVEIRFGAVPMVNAGPDKQIIEGEKVVLEGSGEGLLQWSPAQSLDNASIAKAIASPIVTTIYTLTATSPEGCRNTDEVTVTVLPKLRIPNGISPNGDGINDVWLIEGIEEYPTVTINIYNRWGDKVHMTQGSGTPWDGTRNGAPLPDGAYYYVIDTLKGRKVYTGAITILR